MSSNDVKIEERIEVNPCFRTTSSEYGRLKPNVHTIPNVLYTKSQNFTKELGPCGMYRNHSFNM